MSVTPKHMSLTETLALTFIKYAQCVVYISYLFAILKIYIIFGIGFLYGCSVHILLFGCEIDHWKLYFVIGIGIYLCIIGM